MIQSDREHPGGDPNQPGDVPPAPQNPGDTSPTVPEENDPEIEKTEEQPS